jgi:hypothetical protein
MTDLSKSVIKMLCLCSVAMLRACTALLECWKQVMAAPLILTGQRNGLHVRKKLLVSVSLMETRFLTSTSLQHLCGKGSRITKYYLNHFLGRQWLLLIL